MRKLFLRALLAIVVFVCGVMLVSCSNQAERGTSGEPVQTESRLAGDEVLPELNGDYSYVLAKALSKSPENNSITVEALAWEDEAPFNKGTVEPGAVGEMLCSELVLYPAGIQEGTIIAISCLTEDADNLPVTAYSIEHVDWFNDRVARWVEGS